MDPLTHALSGALLASAAASRHSPAFPGIITPSLLPLRLQIAAGFTAAIFPDLDFALRLVDTLTYLNWHQGPTHSLIMLPLWAWMIAYAFARFARGCYTWRQFYFPACLGLAIHIAGDLITAYGLMLFAPFSIARYSLPLVFVIDPWFTLIIITGLLITWLYPNQRCTAIIALIGLTGYVLFLWIQHKQAVDIAANHTAAISLPLARINVIPQPLSPFHWKIIIQENENYHVALVNLRKSNKQPENQPDSHLLSKIASAYRPIAENSWHVYKQFGGNPTQTASIQEAWLQPSFEPFRTFSQFPILERVEHTEKGLCYWFYDLRFKFPELPPSFRFGICREDHASGWQMYRDRGLFYID